MSIFIAKQKFVKMSSAERQRQPICSNTNVLKMIFIGEISRYQAKPMVHVVW